MNPATRLLLEHPIGRRIAGKDSAFVVRAPGRVNLIGEHTDYNGLPVLPMAIDRDITIIAAPTDVPTIKLWNVDAEFQPGEFEISGDITPFPQGDWGNYAKAAVQAIAQWSGASLVGFEGLVSGDIPLGAGLSSSSAMVVASALAVLHANRVNMPEIELAELLARGERYVGTQGGGMDQAISLMAEDGKALKIDFFPIRVKTGDLPKGCSIVVCNSLVTAEKAGKARDVYNTRVIECRIGLAILKKLLQNVLPAECSPKLLGDLTRVEYDLHAETLFEAVENLPDKVNDETEAARLATADLEEVRELLRLQDGTLLTVPEAGFKIRSRCKHVFTEAVRVEKAAQTTDTCAFGRLMNESHASCAIDYEVSCPELDSLTLICRESGAVGARLTGAGFGGCAIALVPDDQVLIFRELVIKNYYSDYLPKNRPDISVPKDLSRAIFACKPASGATTSVIGES